MAATRPTLPGIDLGDPTFWAQPLDDRDRAFARLRAELPVSFATEELLTLPGSPAGPGFWNVTRFDDVRDISRRPQLFSSAKGITFGEQPEETLEFLGGMIVLDDPRHAKLRLIVQKGFTPRTVATVEEQVRARARSLVQRAKETGGECDFVEHFAAPLPLQVICDLLGVPEADERQIFEWTNTILGAGDPEFAADLGEVLMAAIAMSEYAQALGQDRLDHPGTDITSDLMRAEVDGQRLTTSEFASFFILLAIAGNETTRNAISWGMHQLTAHPDQRRAWQADPLGLAPSAVDEIVRWASPVLHMRRTATDDTVVGEQPIAAGEKVVMWYWSANRDEHVFADGHRFDITRSGTANQAGFGSGGPHFCLGANLARREIAVMFEEIFTTLPDLETVGDPDRLQSAFINGIKRMPCRFSV